MKNDICAKRVGFPRSGHILVIALLGISTLRELCDCHVHTAVERVSLMSTQLQCLNFLISNWFSNLLPHNLKSSFILATTYVP